MFSALSNFIFGAEKAPPVETPVEYDMKEDDEWLLVDVSGDKENTPEPVDDVKDEPVKDCNAGIGTNVYCADDAYGYIIPHLPSLPSFNNTTLSLINIANCVPSVICPLYAEARTFPPAMGEYNAQLVNSKTELATLQQCRMRFMARAIMRMKGTKVLYDIIGSSNPEDLFLKLKDLITSREREVEDTASVEEVKSDEVPHLSPVPVESKPSVKLSKKEYLKEIQGLIHIQEAKEYQAKKYVKRSQLNRRNRVCMYESSNKNRHRRDQMWQHHSGANNNRKSQ